jgi:inosine-uridine nucleoside N-ribohydrolase
MRGAALIVLALLASLTYGCGGSGTDSRLPLVVDTDLSSDDTVALLYLTQDRHVDLRAVTVAGTGLVHCPEGARIALDLLALGGRPDVPVACGSESALDGSNSAPAEWRAAADNGFGLTMPPAKRRPDRDAVALLRRFAPGATVLELAPMTNLAGALRAEPRLAHTLRRVVAMGGAISVPGNAAGNPSAETNAWLDPAAARIVLGAGAPVTLVPLDATNQVPVTTFVAQALARYHYATPAATLASELLAATNMARGGSYFWDPLAAAAVTAPSLVDSVTRRLAVTAEGRLAPDAQAPAIRVVARVDRSGFERELLRTLLRGAPFSIPPQRPQGALTFAAGACGYSGARRLTAGPVVLDTVNRDAAQFEFVAGRLDDSHSLADLRRYASTIKAATRPPRWFTVDASGWTPPQSDMTWVVNLPTGTTGETVLACVSASPVRAAVVASLPVYAPS